MILGFSPKRPAVMVGLVPTIHVFLPAGSLLKTWMVGTSPTMTGGRATQPQFT
jgi:hypothetical protein